MSNTLSATFTPVDYSLHDIRFTTGRILRVGFISKVFDFMPDGTPIIFTAEQTSRYSDRYHNTYLDGEYQMKFEVQFCFFAEEFFHAMIRSKRKGGDATITPLPFC